MIIRSAVALAILALLLGLTVVNTALYDPSECCHCSNLKPKIRTGGPSPQVMPSPFQIKVVEDKYRQNAKINVKIVATAPHAYRAFFIGAYRWPYRLGDNPVGQMKLNSGQKIQVTEDCKSPDMSNYALSSQDNYPKRNLDFTWMSREPVGHVEFRATFIVDDNTYWVSEKSSLLIDPTEDTFPIPKAQYTARIDTSTCGVNKGCFRHPAGCVESECEYILTWTSEDSQDIEFELGGLADGKKDRYVAFGLSDDTYMGDDTVFVCAHNSARDTTELFLSYNQDDPKKNVLVRKYDSSDRYDMSLYTLVRSEEGSYQNGRLRCRFVIQRDLSNLDGRLRDIRGGPAHILFARGFASNGQVKRHALNVEELPIASADAVDLGNNGDYNGRAKYPLAKAHGCLMIIAWVLFASISLIISKYFTTMWPNQRYYDQKYWYIIHFNTMAMMFILSIIGIIIIFVEAGGYSEAPSLPQKAHPILGIIILVCICFIPIICIIRPHEEHKCRPLFNWIYWVFWTVAWVLCIPNIFIGMDFGKVGVPWWATWILVIWVIFHIVCELTLEIHQCCTYKKNKDRRKKWEQMRREYPKQTHPEPEPAGRRFKRFMLCLHVCFTILIVFIMVIIIAVS